MSDMEELGLKVGLEIHQQLAGRKLFCRCPAEIIEGEPDLVFTRRLRASAGETGGVDVAAQAEQAKGREFVYHAFQEACCLVELDEEPPHPASAEALTTAAMVAKAFGSTILPRVQFMRKTIVDGSNVSGFQRTGLFALGGKVPDSDVRIQTICVEEESAKIVARDHDRSVYNLSRLGVPLLEIATEPDITTPEQAREVAAQIGMVLRSTGRVKRGLGTIRQDLNVSIAGGERCEIKGAQDLRQIVLTITNEALRQRTLLDIRDELQDELQISEVTDVTAAFTGDLKPFIRKGLAHGRALGVSVKGFKGFLGRELFPGYRLGTELAGIAKTWGFGGIIHSDEDLTAYGLSDEMLREEFVCGEEDGFLILVGDAQRAAQLLNAQLVPRLRCLKEGIPREVRRANPDGTSSFLRPMSSGLRMYPETDIPIVIVDASGARPPKLLSEQLADLVRETGLSRDVAKAILDQGIPVLEYRERYPELEYGFLSSALLEWPREVIARIGVEFDAEPYVSPLLAEVAAGRLAADSVKAILEEVAAKLKEGKLPDVSEIAGRYGKLSDAELRSVIDSVVAAKPGARAGALMGEVMASTRGRADGKRIAALLKERLGTGGQS